MIATDTHDLIVGAGLTGLSVARYLEKKGASYSVYDTREEKDQLIFSAFYDLNKKTRCVSGSYLDDYLIGVSRIILSPGVTRTEKIVAEALSRGIPVISDIRLFLDAVSVPVIGITGTNGKSTVTTMVGLAAEQAGIHVAVGGNLGVPALDLIDINVTLYVLELSSFQLENTDHAALSVAVNINMSPDHLDRHGSMADYFQAKQKIFHGAQTAVYNLTDKLTQPPIAEGVKRFGFGLNRMNEVNEVQFVYDAEKNAIRCDKQIILKRSDIKLVGKHNLENILAVFAITFAANINQDATIHIVKQFCGLPHRCEWVGEYEGVKYINDSKATNVGATKAALLGLKNENKIILIAGGESKGADFTQLGKVITDTVGLLITFGVDAEILEDSVAQDIHTYSAENLTTAVQFAKTHAKQNDIVLLSPACASFDMFKDFEHRGECFKNIVKALCA